MLTAEELRGLSRGRWTVVDAPDPVAIPGFIQTHVHLCQTLFRGLAEDVELLDWLRLRIFPFEAAHSAASMYASARVGIAELIRSGTTTIMDMGSIHHEEEVVRAVTESGIRAFLGKAMMDINEHYSAAARRDKGRRGVHAAAGRALARERGRTDPVRRRAALHPVMQRAPPGGHAMTDAFPGVLFHTHASENRHELEAVRARCGMDNVDYFGQLGSSAAVPALRIASG